MSLQPSPPHLPSTSPRGGESRGPEVDGERRSVGGGRGGGGTVAEAGPPGSVAGRAPSTRSWPGWPWRVARPEERTLLVTWFRTAAGLSSPTALVAFPLILLSPAGRPTWAVCPLLGFVHPVCQGRCPSAWWGGVSSRSLL